MARKKDFVAYYAIREPRHSWRGIFATVVGILSLVTFLVMCGVSAALGGKAPEWMGAAGLTAFVFAFFGMVTGLSSFRDQCKSYVFCKTGTLLCGLMVAVWFLTTCVGLAS